MRVNKTREITTGLLTASKSFSVGMHSGICESIWFKAGMMIDTFKLYILIPVCLTLTVIQGHKSARKQNLQRQLSYKVFNRLGWNVVLPGFVGPVNLILILSYTFNIQRREPDVRDFDKK